MFRNYFKIAFRNIQKQKVFAIINILGLSIGIACFSLLLLFAANEFSFDKFHKKASDIYRGYVWLDTNNGQPPIGYTDYSGPGSSSLGEALKQELPDVMDFVRMQLPWNESLVRIGNNMHRVSMTYADPLFFSVFTFPLKHGNAASALHDINDIVLTESQRIYLLILLSVLNCWAILFLPTKY